MHLRATSVFAVLLFACQAAHAQKWAADMVNKLDHDFGTVARGSDTVYRFEFTNKYKEDVHLASVRSSCGCTSPSIENNLIKTWEKGYVVAKFNTRTFTGIHSATLTVTIDKPYPAQVQLRVHGNIRGDIVFEPGALVFGEVDQGEPVEKRITVNYAGRSGWKIEDVRSASNNIEVELTERRRRGGSIAYELLGRLKEDATPGIIKEQLVIVTNDSSNPRVPLDIEARVVPEISVAPANLIFGDVEEGQEATKRVIVRGKAPFKITGIESPETRLSFSTDEKEGDRHIITVAFNATGKPGRLKAPITIATDRGETYTAECTAYASVAAPAEPDKDVAEAGAGGDSSGSTEVPDKNLAQDR